MSIQQGELSSFRCTDAFSIAIHRTTLTSLTIFGNSISTVSRSNDGLWRRSEEWEIPSSSRVLGAFPLESFNGFGIVSKEGKLIVIIFMDLSGSIVNQSTLENCKSCTSFDFDQRRKELIIASNNGVISNFAVRFVGDRNKAESSSYHVIFRLGVKVSLGTITQLCSFDLPGFFLMLNKSGSLTCYETGGMEILFTVGMDRFASCPIKIFPNKFGSNFVVLCQDSDTKRYVAEVWSPPRTFACASAGMFSRAMLPLSGACNPLHFAIETVGGELGCALSVFYCNKSVELWRVEVEGSGMITFLHCMCLVTTWTAFGDPSSVRFKTYLQNAPDENYNNLKTPLGTYGIGQFVPDCTASYTAFVENEYAIVLFRAPTAEDAMANELCNDLSYRRQCLRLESDSNGVGSPPPPAPTAVTTAFNDSASQPYPTRSLSCLRAFTNETVFFAPMALFPKLFKSEDVSSKHALSSQRKSPMLKVMQPSGVLMMEVSDAQNGSRGSVVSMNQITRHGLVDISANANVASQVDIDLCGIASKAGSFCVVTTLKEGLVFNINSRLNCAPLRVELASPSTAKCTFLLMSDVYLQLPPEHITDNLDYKSSSEGSGLVGMHSLCMVGDSDGSLNFGICSPTNVSHQGTIRAHNSAVVSILTTGDAMRNLWRVGSQKLSGSQTMIQLAPCAIPGSAVISIAEDGDFKVWQPMFSVYNSSAKSKSSQIFSIAQLSWRVSGMGNVASNQCRVTSASMDPTCMTVIVGYSDGSLKQWLAPGLIDQGNMKVQSIAPSHGIHSATKHRSSIHSMKLWMHVPNTTIRQIEKPSTLDIRPNKYAAAVGDINTLRRATIGYTIEEMQQLAENSSFVTSSCDLTVILWRLSVSKKTVLPHDGDSMPNGNVITNRYMHLHACQIYVVSDKPFMSICHPFVTNERGTKIFWRVSSIVNGAVVTLGQGTRLDMFAERELAPFAGSEGRVVLSDGYTRSSGVDTMAVMCEILKPQKCVANSLAALEVGNSWDELVHWGHEKDLDLAVDVVLGAGGESDEDDLADCISPPAPAPLEISPSKETQTRPASLKRIAGNVVVKRETAPKKVILGPSQGVIVSSIAIGSDIVDHAAVKKRAKPTVINGIRVNVQDGDVLKLKEVIAKNTKRFTVAKAVPLFSSEKVKQPSSSSYHSHADVDFPTDVLTTSSPHFTARAPFPVESFFNPKNVTSPPALASFVIEESESNKTPRADSLMKEASFELLFLNDSRNNVDQHDESGKGELNQMSLSESRSSRLGEEVLSRIGDMSDDISVGMHVDAKDIAYTILDNMSPILDRNFYYKSQAHINDRFTPSLKQPYTSSGLGYVAPPPQIKEKYGNDGLMKRVTVTACSKERGSGREDINPLAVYKTPFGDGRDGSFENMLRINSYSPEAVPSHFAMPPSYYEKTSQPINLRPSTVDKLLEARANDLKNLREEELLGDDLLDGMELVATQFTQDDLEGSLLPEERSLYSRMSEDERLQYLAAKNMEEARKLEEAKCEFEMLTTGQDKKISMNKLFKWQKVRDALENGFTKSEIKDMVSKSANKDTVNLRQFTDFSNELTRKIAIVMSPPEITVDIVDIRSDQIDFTIMTTRKGTVWAVIMDPAARPLQAIEFDEGVKLKYIHEGVIKIEEKRAEKDRDVVFFSITKLKPDTNYVLFACAEHPRGRKMPSRTTDVMIADTKHEFATEMEPFEDLDVEWGKLSREMRATEVRCAIRSFDVMSAAYNSNIPLPVDEEISDQLNESPDPQSKKVYNTFVRWWTSGDPICGYSEIRRNFLFKEIKFYILEKEAVEHCEDSKYLTPQQSARLFALASLPDSSDLLASEEYRIFRSWIKGGAVIMKRIALQVEAKERKQFLKEREAYLEGSELRCLKRVETLHMQLEAENEDEENEENEENDDDDDDDDDDETENGNVFGSDDGDDELVISSESDDNSDEDYDPVADQLDFRTDKLEERVVAVDKWIGMVASLHEQYKIAMKCNLSFPDLVRKRGKLRYDDVTTIMASKKYLELCELRACDPATVMASEYQKLSASDTFTEGLLKELSPDEPPQATLMSIVGSDKRPLKEWIQCGPQERKLEVQIACMLTSVMELAVEGGTCVPDAEDVHFAFEGHYFQTHRSQRWNTFIEWYVGKEMAEFRPYPSIARIIFADWEKQVIKRDESIVNFLNSVVVPETSGLLTSSTSTRQDKKLLKKRSSELSLVVQKHVSSQDDQEYFTKYSDAVGALDNPVRISLLSRYIKSMADSRGFGIMRKFSPPIGPGKVAFKFVFPRLGMLTPKYEKRVFRFCVFPSVEKEKYSVDEIMSWFKDYELQDDDAYLKRSQEEGWKRQEYLNWLAKEEERINQGRVAMVAEDLASYAFNKSANTAGSDFEVILGKPRFKDFSYGNKLPGKYEYLREIPPPDMGTGLHNEDEVQDIVEEMARNAEIAMLKKKEMLKKTMEERKRKEEEARIQKEKEEIDQRIRDNQDRLRKIRANLEDLKLQRKLEAEQALKDQHAQQMEKERQLQQEMFEHAQKLQMDKAIARANEERSEMELEDAYSKLVSVRRKDRSDMAMEDEMAQHRRREDMQRRERRAIRCAELEELYTPFEPFAFKKSKILVPIIHLDSDCNVIDDMCGNDDESKDKSWILPLKLNTIKTTGDYDFSLSGYNSTSDSLGDGEVLDEDVESGVPLIWRGPSDEAVKKYSKLARKQSPYSTESADAAALTRKFKAISNEVVFLKSDHDDRTLFKMGVPKSVVRTFSRHSSNRKMSPTEGVSSRQSHSPIYLPPLSSAKNKKAGDGNVSAPAALSNSSPRESFLHPLVYQKDSSHLQLCMSLNDEDIRKNISIPAAIRVNLKDSSISATTLLKSQSLGKIISKTERDKSLMASMLSMAEKPIRDSKHYQKKITPREQSSRARDSVLTVERNNSIANIRTQKKALHDFIYRSELDEDKYYAQACRPGLRSRDSISEMIAQRLESELKMDHITGFLEEGEKLLPNEDTDRIEVEQEFPSPPPPTLVAADALAHECTNEAAKEGDVVLPLCDSVSRGDSVPSLPGVRIPQERDRSKYPDYRQEKTAGPFYRKTFGVSGKPIVIDVKSPMFVANELIKRDIQAETNASNIIKSTTISRQKNALGILKKQYLDSAPFSISANR